jgi:DNA-directed RNA polymerase subunit RPC12/RpoP
MPKLNGKTLEPSNREEKIQCPYCLKHTNVVPASDYAPIYVRCAVCDKKFILERLIDGFQALRIEGAPCTSDPDRREIEMGLGQED